jgi:hypothetical protein
MIVGCSDGPGGQTGADQGKPLKYEIVPVAGPPQQVNGEYYWSAWRINKESGDTDFCTFDSGDPNPTQAHHNPGGITCSAADRTAPP